ncbi:DUF3810 domain-containing protein [Algibacter mikhailovii]|uniref:DUF3810 domain-containing protein n=1 Tax=Algibacter mikhailovii TaxID=425498 RepID=UPI0024942316|nr:DUF3810 domain-containing protein [Algibacter mikhailovii]
MLKKKKTIIALSLIPQILIVRLLSQYPEFIERYYSNGLYEWLSKVFRFVLGWLPFSFGDVLYIFMIVYLIRWLVKNRRRLRNDTKNWLLDVLSTSALFYFAFHLFWGLNYYRLPLHKSLKLDHEYTTDQLIELTEKLIKKSNTLHTSLASNDSLPVTFPYSKNDIFKMTSNGYEHLKAIFPNLEYHPKSIKKSLISYPLSYMGYSGYLNPLTNEAHVNGLLPTYRFPTTSAHEIAHQLGYAAENEANFIGFLASIKNDNAYINYSGYTFGLSYCLNEVYRRDEALYETMLESVNKGILKNSEEVRRFYEAFENPAEPFFKLFMDNFLKANNQSKGMQSYSYVVALLVNYFEKENL